MISFRERLSAHMNSSLLKRLIISGMWTYFLTTLLQIHPLWHYLSLRFIFNSSALVYGFAAMIMSMVIFNFRSHYATGSRSVQSNNALLLMRVLSIETIHSAFAHSLFTTSLCVLSWHFSTQSFTASFFNNVLFSGLVLGSIYSFERKITCRDDLIFPAQQQTITRRLKRALPKSVLQGVFRGTVYNVAIGSFTRAAKLLLLPGLLSKYSGSTLNFSWDISFSTTVLIICSLEAIHSLFDVFATEGLFLSSGHEQVELILSSQNESLSPFSSYHLYLLIHNTFKYSPAARKLVFADVESPSTAWKIISSLLLNHLNGISGKLETALKRQSPDSKSSKLSQPLSASSTTILSKKLASSAERDAGFAPPSISPTKRGSNIYAPQKSSGMANVMTKTLQFIGSEDSKTGFENQRTNNVIGTFPTNKDVSSETDTGRPFQNEADAPSLLRYRGSAKEAPRSSAAIAPVFNERGHLPPSTSDMMEALVQHMRKTRLGKAFLREDLVRFTTAMFNDIQLHTWAVQALVDLTVSSAHEDKYGTVHRDLPLILQSLARLHIAIRTYQKSLLEHYGDLAASVSPAFMNAQRTQSPWNPEPFSSSTMLGMDRVHFGAWKMLQEPNRLLYTVETGLYRIVTTFYSHLNRFQYQKEYAEVLERFTTFSQ